MAQPPSPGLDDTPDPVAAESARLAALAAANGPARTDYILERLASAPGEALDLATIGAGRAVLDDVHLSAASLQSRFDTAGPHPPWWDPDDGGAALSNAVFAGASLHRADFSGAMLRGADFGKAAMRSAVLAGACLEAAAFEGADLNGANLSGTRASEAVFRDALLEDANFAGAMLRFVDFGGALLDSANFEGADLWGARLPGAELPYANLRGATLQEAVLSDADLTGADLREAVLKRANLRGARLRGANLEGADLGGADLEGADLTNASLPRVNLSNCAIPRIRLSGAWLESTRFAAGQLGGALGEELAREYEPARLGYLAMEQNFRALGNAEAASWSYRRARRMGKRDRLHRARASVRHRQPIPALLHYFHYTSDAFVEWLCDYGESLSRVLRAYAVAVGIFALLYGLAGGIVRTEDAPVAQSRVQTAKDALRFSFLTMTSGSSFESGIRPDGETMSFVASLQYTLAVILTGLFGYVLGNRIRR